MHDKRFDITNKHHEKDQEKRKELYYYVEYGVTTERRLGYTLQLFLDL